MILTTFITRWFPISNVALSDQTLDKLLYQVGEYGEAVEVGSSSGDGSWQ